MHRMVAFCSVITVVVGCSQNENSVTSDNEWDGKSPMKIQTLSTQIDSFGYVHTALLQAIRDSLISGNLTIAPLNPSFDDQVRLIATNKLSSYGITYTHPTGFLNDSLQLGTTIPVMYSDTCSWLSLPAKAILHSLDSLMDQYCIGSINLATFTTGCYTLKSSALSLSTNQALAVGAGIMTAMSSAQFWYSNATIVDNYTPYALAATDKKILVADRDGAMKGFIGTLITTGNAGGAIATGFFGGAVASFFKGAVIGFKAEGTWLETVGNWLF